MNFKKLIAVAICILLVLGLFACTQKSDTPTTDEVTEKPSGAEPAEEKPNGEETSEGEEQPAEESKATSEMDFDLGGKTIRLVSWYDELGFLEGEDPDSIQKRENLEALQKKHNFKLEMVVIDYGEIKDKVTASLLAGDPVGEIIRFVRPWMIPSLVAQDLFWPVEEYVKNDEVFRLEYTNEFFEYKGRGYGFRIGVPGAANGIVYNRTLMKRLGIKPLQEYIDEDNWTWETFLEVAKSATRDTDNDGKLDVWGLATSDVLVPALASNEAILASEGAVTLDDPKTVEVLNFINRLVTENVARPPETDTWDEPFTFFIEGNVLMVPGHDYNINDWRPQMPDVDLGFLPFPKGPSAEAYHGYLTIPNCYTIPKTIEHPEWLVYIIEKINDIDSVYEYPNQASFESTFTTEEDINNARLVVDAIRRIETVDYYPNMPYYDFVGELRSGVSVSTLIEKYKAPFQAAVDEVWIMYN